MFSLFVPARMEDKDNSTYYTCLDLDPSAGDVNEPEEVIISGSSPCRQQIKWEKAGVDS